MNAGLFWRLWPVLLCSLAPRETAAAGTAGGVRIARREGQAVPVEEADRKFSNNARPAHRKSSGGGVLNLLTAAMETDIDEYPFGALDASMQIGVDGTIDKENASVHTRKLEVGDDFLTVGDLLVIRGDEATSNGLASGVNSAASSTTLARELAVGHVGLQKVTIVTTWALMHSIGNHTSALNGPELSLLVVSLRDAMADSIMVCRSCVEVTDIRGVNVDLVEPKSHLRNFDASLAQAMISVFSGVLGGQMDTTGHLNLTQFKAAFEVRVFPEMGRTKEAITNRLDRLQIYNQFTTMRRLVKQAFERNNYTAMEGVIVDDIGVGSVEEAYRPGLAAADVEECREEEALLHARRAHPYIVVLCLVIVALSACAGSAIFTLKTPTVVPSRLNSLGLGNQWGH